MWASENQTSHMGKPGRGTRCGERVRDRERCRHIPMSSQHGAMLLGYIKLKDTLVFAYVKICSRAQISSNSAIKQSQNGLGF